MADIGTTSKEIYSAFKSKPPIYFILDAWRNTLNFVISALNNYPTHSKLINLLIDWAQICKASIDMFKDKIKKFVSNESVSVVTFWTAVFTIFDYYLQDGHPFGLILNNNHYLNLFSIPSNRTNIVQFLLGSFNDFNLDDFERDKKVHIHVNRSFDTSNGYGNTSNNWQKQHFPSTNNSNPTNRTFNRNYNRNNNNRQNNSSQSQTQDTANNNNTNSRYPQQHNSKLSSFRKTCHICMGEYGATCPGDICMFKFFLGLCKNPNRKCGKTPNAVYKHACAFHPDKDHTFKTCETAASKPNIQKQFIEKFNKIKF